MDNEITFALLYDNNTWEEQSFAVPLHMCWNEEDCQGYVQKTYMAQAQYRRVVAAFLFDDLPAQEG